MSERLTPESVRDVFTYDDGALLWRIRPSRNTDVGKAAGHKARTNHVVVYRSIAYSRAKLVWAWHKGKWPERAIRHINGDSYDDRIENLSDAPERAKTNPVHGIARYETSSGERYRVCTTAIFADLPTAERALNAARKALRDAAL